jgi:hypothetical protein
MRRNTKLLHVTAALSLAISLLFVTLGHVSVQADPANVPSLVISQVKITSGNGQFVTLYNTTNSAVDLNKYQLEYFNSYDLSKATSSKLIALSGMVPPHGYYLVNDSALLLCYQLTVDSVSLGLSSTAGLIELLGFNQASPGGSVVPALQDYVGWSKTAASGAQTLPASVNAFLARRPLNSQNQPLVAIPGAGTWQSVQPDSNNPCNLVSADGPTPVQVVNSAGALLPSTEPPSTIVSLANNMTDTPIVPVLPAADVGLMAPEVTDLLPNPNGTGNDATDEFVELYNPNPVKFDLTGFILQSGTTSLHKYTFSADSGLLPNGFMAYYSVDTGLSLSNSGGQVKLLDPTGKAVASTDAYGTANDGQTWALAKGKWYWTTAPTPGAANTIKQPAASSKTSRNASKTAKSSISKINGTAGQSASSTASSGAVSDSTALTPIHPWILALVAAAALLYVGYEYRTDLANRLWQFRNNVGSRRRHRP